MRDIFVSEEFRKGVRWKPQCHAKLPARNKYVAVYITRDRAKTVLEFHLMRNKQPRGGLLQ